MFRGSSAHLQEDTVVYMQHMVLSLSMRVRGGTHQQPSPSSQFSLNLCTDRPPRTLIESDNSVCCMYTTVSSWRWALETRNM